MPAPPKTAHQHFTRGGQITFHNLRMFCQVNKALFKWTACGVLLLTALISWLVIDADTWHGARYYAWFAAQSWFRDATELVTLHWQGQTYQNTLGALRDNALLHTASQTFWWRVQLVFLGCSLLGFVVIWLVVRYFQYQGDKQTQDRFIRGIQQASPGQLARLLKQRRDASSFLLDGHRLLRDNFEVQHVLIDGTTGSGKSVAIRKLLRWIRQRGDKAIVYDKGCSFIADFYDPPHRHFTQPV